MDKNKSIWLLIATVFVVVFAFDGRDATPEISRASSVPDSARAAEQPVDDTSDWEAGPSDDWFGYDSDADNDDGEVELADYRSDGADSWDETYAEPDTLAGARPSYVGVPVKSNGRPGRRSGRSFDPRLKVHKKL